MGLTKRALLQTACFTQRPRDQFGTQSLQTLRNRSMKEQRTDSPQVPEWLAGAILLMRGQRVILDADLAGLYEVPVKGLIRAVKRNLDRFPADFMFQLEKQEVARLRYQFGTSNGRGGRRYAPCAFTEQGVAMLSSVLRSKRAVLVNVEIMRAFVQLRQMLASNAELARKLSSPHPTAGEPVGCARAAAQGHSNELGTAL